MSEIKNGIKKESEYVDEESDGFEQKVKKLRKLLKKCSEDKREYLEGWQRARAEFQNYKKREEAEAGELRKFMAQETIRELLPVLDNLNLACNSIPETLTNHDWVEGVMHIRKQFENVLGEQGVEEMEISETTEFNPAKHTIIEEVESSKGSGAIVRVVEKGYMMHGKVIRPARVTVAKY